jgi:hypothetical protein
MGLASRIVSKPLFDKRVRGGRKPPAEGNLLDSRALSGKVNVS